MSDFKDGAAFALNDVFVTLRNIQLLDADSVPIEDRDGFELGVLAAIGSVRKIMERLEIPLP